LFKNKCKDKIIHDDIIDNKLNLFHCSLNKKNQTFPFTSWITLRT